MQRAQLFEIWLNAILPTNKSHVHSFYSSIISLRPVMAAPMVVPLKEFSAIGVSRTLRSSHLGVSPLVTLHSHPFPFPHQDLDEMLQRETPHA